MKERPNPPPAKPGRCAPKPCCGAEGVTLRWTGAAWLGAVFVAGGGE